MGLASVGGKKKNNSAVYNNGFICLQLLERSEMQNSQHSTASAHKQVWDGSKMPRSFVLQEVSNEKPNFRKVEILQHTKPLERNLVKLSGSGIKPGCIWNWQGPTAMNGVMSSFL